MDLKGRVFLITGANTGIGKITALELARRGAHTVLACRSKERTQPVLDQISRECPQSPVTFLTLDLASLDSVRQCAAAFLELNLPLHVLINNAGLAGLRAVTKDGFELIFGVNHLGHFLLTLLLMDKLRDSPPARIINVSSKAHYKASSLNYDALRKKASSFTSLAEYQVSKLANVLFTAELTRRLKGTSVIACSLHPGVVASDVWRKIPWPIRPLVTRSMISIEEGALTTLHCATSPEVVSQTALYYDECRPREPNPVVHNEALAAELWEKSLAWTGAPDF